ncbi:MAG: amidohydrolase [Desulfovibrionaceae bacterium]
MLKRIHEQTLALTPLITALRRDIHKHPEKAWCEYRTTAMIARHLKELGYSVVMGPDAHVDSLRYALPDAETSRQAQERAVSQGADAQLVQRMGKGFTGLWADLDCPAATAKGQTGPCIAIRFDMDALELTECASPEHRPVREGFSSVYDGTMHACGHDGHAALGMGVAAIIKSLQPELRGKVRLIFQPAEEGAHGAMPMAAAGAVDGVDVLLGLHFGVQAQDTGEIICGTADFLATSTIDVRFDGNAAHAGIAPQQGKNALLAACSAVLNMHAISRHGQGDTRVNVGQIGGGDATNIIPAHAWIQAETRGTTTEINTYMMDEAKRIVQAAAHMWNCQCTINPLGECPSGNSSPELCNIVEQIAKSMGTFTTIHGMKNFMASEDFTIFLNKVQKNGGIGTYIQIGATRPSGHHTHTFDFDEAAIAPAMEILVRLVAHYAK